VRAPAYVSRSFPHCVVDAWNYLPTRFFAPGFGLDKAQDFKVAANAFLRGDSNASAPVPATAPAAARPAAPVPRRRDDDVPLDEDTYVRLHAATFGVMPLLPQLS